MRIFVPCRTCSKLPGPKPGYYYVEKDRQRYVYECECHLVYRKNALYEIRAKQASLWSNPPDILKTYLGEKSRKSKDSFVKYIDNFEKFSDKVVYLYGPNGTQKTSLAMWGGYELIKRDFKVNYTLMYVLVGMLSGSFDKREENDLQIENLKKSDLLIIDESFTKDKVLLYKSGYQLPFLDSFLRERIDMHKKGTLFISNKSPSSIASEGFGVSLQDFIQRNTRETTLEFLDNYVANDINDFSARSIFN